MPTRRWRIRLAVVAVAGASSLARLSAMDIQRNASYPTSTNTTGTIIDPTHLHPRVATYRNAYGTHFRCTSTCYFIMWTYLVCVAVLLALLAVIPVQTPVKPENVPFVLWRDNNPPADYGETMLGSKKKKMSTRRYGLMDRLSMWFYGYEEPVSSESEGESESFHEDIDLLTENIEPEKTFESIGVETDDSLLPRLLTIPRSEDDCVVVDDVDRLFDPLPGDRGRKPGIFAPVTPRGGDAPDAQMETSRRGSLSPNRGRSMSMGGRGAVGRRASVLGSTVSDPSRDNLLEEVERRSSMQKRAEKRKEYAKSDIAHDNLHEHELHMYDYLEFIRSLLEGIAVRKITQKSGKVVKRTFFITPDLNTVYWNQMGSKGWIVKKSSIDSTEISHVTKGAGGNASQGKHGKQDLCLTIIMNNGKRLVLEAKDDVLHRRLFLGFSRLAVEKREEKRKREAGNMDDEQRDVEHQDDSETKAGDQQTQEHEEEMIEETDAQDLEAQANSAETERQAKSEEDDPKRWRDDREEKQLEGNQEEKPDAPAVVVVGYEDEE